MVPPVRLERRAEDRAVTGEHSVARGFLDQQLEDVTGLEVALEVDLAAEDIRQRHRELDVFPGVVHGRNQRRMLLVDHPPDDLDAPLLLVEEHLRVEQVGLRVIAGEDLKEPVGVDLVLELLQEPVDCPHQSIRLILAKLAKVEHRSRRVNGRLHEVRRKVVIAQQAIERGVRRHERIDDLQLRRQVDVGTVDRRGRRRGLACARAPNQAGQADAQQSGHDRPRSLARTSTGAG